MILLLLFNDVAGNPDSRWLGSWWLDSCKCRSVISWIKCIDIALYVTLSDKNPSSAEYIEILDCLAGQFIIALYLKPLLCKY